MAPERGSNRNSESRRPSTWKPHCQPNLPTIIVNTRAALVTAFRYTEGWAEAGIEPSVGSVGDSYDNALTETVISLFKAEVIHRRGRGDPRGGRVRHAQMGEGSTTVGCSNRSATSLLPRRRQAIMPRPRSKPWPPEPNQMASEKPGAVHSPSASWDVSRTWPPS